MNLSFQSIGLIAVIGLIGIGIYGLLITRNMIKVIVALQILVKGVLIAFILAGSMQAKVNQAQSLALTVLIADTIVAVVALGLAVQVRKAFGSLDIKELTELKR
jgi:NADH:ubiquinone oxidoreductase subunit K